MTFQDPAYALWLHESGLSRAVIGRLLERGEAGEDLPKTLFAAKRKDLLLRFPEEAAERLLSARAADPHMRLERLKERGIHFAFRGGPRYPSRLLSIPDPPWGLYWRGELPGELLPSAAVVGTREMTGYGRSMAASLARHLSARGVTVVSGMARGIDTAAGMAALEGRGGSAAVLGCGVDVCYPEENRDFFERLAREGGLISEYPPGTPPRPFRFPERNRLIAGLADVVCVAEAGERSGSAHTAAQALDQGKDVFALPGRVSDPMSRGCNRLIRDGAGILLCASDVLLCLGMGEGRGEDAGQTAVERLLAACAKERGQIYPEDLEELMERAFAMFGRRFDIREVRGAMAGLVAGDVLRRAEGGTITWRSC